MTETFVEVYDSSTYIDMSRRNVQIKIEFGEESKEYEQACEELTKFVENKEIFTFPPDASYVTYDGIDLRVDNPFDDDGNIKENDKVSLKDILAVLHRYLKPTKSYKFCNRDRKLL